MKITLALVTLLFATACVTTKRDNTGASVAKRSLATSQSGWTTDFLRNRLLVADEVRIVGPEGLRAHIVTRFDPAFATRKEETIPEGYLQTFHAKPGADRALACYLDKLQIQVIRKLTVLERPGPFDVVVEAVGEVYYVDIDAHREQRLPSVRIEGKIQR